METVRLRYGNTNTFLVGGRLLMDTDYAGTMRAFFKALKAHGIRLDTISHVMATHYHPDHCGVIGELQQRGVRLVLLEAQKESVHFPDYIFRRDGIDYVPIDTDKAEIIRFSDSRQWLRSLNINGEIISTPSHSADSVSLILDNGDCIVGDLQPEEYLESYEDNSALKEDWERIKAYNPNRILFAHMPEKRMK